MAVCGFGDCSKDTTPILITSPNGYGGTIRERFCCMKHAAAWAIKEMVEERNNDRSISRDQEARILDHIDAVTGKL